MSVFHLSQESAHVLMRRRAVCFRQHFCPVFNRTTELVLQLIFDVAPIYYEFHIRRVSDIVDYRGPFSLCIGSSSNSSRRVFVITAIAILSSISSIYYPSIPISSLPHRSPP